MQCYFVTKSVILEMHYVTHYISNTFAQIYGEEKLWQISHQKFLPSKTSANSCLFAFLIVQTINGYT